MENNLPIPDTVFRLVSGDKFNRMLIQLLLNFDELGQACPD